MTRTQIRNFAGSLLAAITLLATGTALAADAQWSDGNGYKVVSDQAQTDTPEGKSEVIEFFWYGCPHCYALEPALESWVKKLPDNVEFRRIPAVTPAWEPDARAYYVAQMLGITDKVHKDLFDAIHIKRQLDLVRDEDAIAEFFSNYGVSKSDVKAAWHSFTVDSKIKEAKRLERRYHLTGVPMLVVNGKYTTGAGFPGIQKEDQILDVVDFLLKKKD